jgi:hypothetical protein
VRPYLRIALTAMLLVAAPFLLAGCDGEGLTLVKDVTSGDNPPPQDGGDGDDGDGNGGSGSTDVRFTGTWMASYSDDFTTSLTQRGAFEYATVLRLTHQNTSITGNGSMYRFVRQGTTAYTNYPFTVQGTASGADAVLTLRPSQGNAFDALPVWYVRLAGSRIVGMYQETSANGSLIRGGHATFLKSTTGALDGAWASVMSDTYALSGSQRAERTGSLNLTVNADSTLSGEGSFEIQTDANSTSADFDVTRGGFKTPDTNFTLGGIGLGSNTIDLVGFFTGSAVVSAYGEFDGSNGLTRLGHTTWYRTPEPTTSAVTRDWVVSFSDSATAGNVPANDYLIVLSLQARDGGGVSGSGTMRIEGENTALENFSVVNGSLVGSLLHIELRNSLRTLAWDLRMAGSSLMVGTYRQTNSAGNFVSRGAGEWRPESPVNLKGTWTTSYFDTYGAAEPENTQIAIVTVSRQEANGALAGTGGLRFAGDTRRRLFNLDGNAEDDEVIWVWRSQDLFGITTWHLRQAGNFLFGTYINEDSSGNLEYRGNALWVRTNLTDTISQ